MTTGCAATWQRYVLAVWLSFFSLSSSYGEIVPSVTDDDGRQVQLSAPAQRIVTLAPSLTELVYAAGAGEKLAGVSAYSDYPPSAQALPRIADAAGISWESLLAVKPDLVLAWKGGTRPAEIARLSSLGVTVFVIEVRTLDDVSRALRSIGKLAGRPDAAETAAREYQRKLTALREANAGKRNVSTFFGISSKPLMTINRDHVISEMIGLCGGSNIFADLPALASEPSREALLARSPETILYGVSLERTKGLDIETYAGLSAMAEGRSYGITADFAFRPGPRLLLATAEICTALDRSRENLKVQKKR